MTTLAQGTVHPLPSHVEKAIAHNKDAVDAWNRLTPLARNEWICWITSPKKQETRDDHLQRTVKELTEGVRRPCCWMGCIHRTDKEISPSVRGIINNRS